MRKFLHNNAVMNEMMDLRTFSTIPRVRNGVHVRIPRCVCPSLALSGHGTMPRDVALALTYIQASHATLPSNAIELKIFSEATAEDTSCVRFKAEHKPSMV